jgi:hypothetical protein
VQAEERGIGREVRQIQESYGRPGRCSDLKVETESGPVDCAGILERAMEFESTLFKIVTRALVSAEKAKVIKLSSKERGKSERTF